MISIGRGGADELTGSVVDNVMIGGSGDDRLAGQGGDDRLEGGTGDDVLDGGSGSDVLDGGAGNDTLTVHYNHGGNRLIGGAGDDDITGSYRDDTYVYRRGDGRDVIRENYHYSGSDTLILEDLNPEDVVLTREGKALVVNVPADGGQVKISNWYAADYHRVEQVSFADGTVWDVNTLHHAGLEVRGSEGADTLNGLDNQADRLYGQGGNDVLNGKNGHDRLLWWGRRRSPEWRQRCRCSRRRCRQRHPDGPLQPRRQPFDRRCGRRRHHRQLPRRYLCLPQRATGATSFARTTTTVAATRSSSRT
jgi:Ca2+-binding RTX toxin-like protein